MSELLIELFSEEIPAMMQGKAELAYVDIFKKYFQNKDIGFGEIQVFIGPRRITIIANGLDKHIQSKAVSIKGPRTDAPAPAIDGFCKSNNVPINELVKRDVKGIQCYFYEKEIAGQETKTILEASLAQPLMEYVWPKSMHWGDYKIKWVRPIQNILCIFDEEVVPFKLGHLTANDKTFGHRFMCSDTRHCEEPNSVTKQSPATQALSFHKIATHLSGARNDVFAIYQQTLKDNFVILSRAERKNIIKEAMQKKADALKLVIKDDPLLLEEVAGLVEFPVVMLCTIEKKFLKLPSEVLVSSMRTHQKYFSLFDQNGNFAPYFLFVSNMNPADHKYIIEGNERVLSARLSDALYFYHQDLKKPLESQIDALDKVVFHAKLGSLKAKTERLASLTKFIDPKSHAAYEAALICKSDILSEVVGEFPELQGIMGYYYALSNGKSEAVATSIRDHYKPQGPSDSAPSDAAAILALADKIDSLCGLMIAGFKPTGSKDPYALRRLALGIIRIILENNLQQNIVKLVEFCCSLYMPIINNNSKDINEIIAFIEERGKNYFKDDLRPRGDDKERGDDNWVRQINAAVNLTTEPDLIITNHKLAALKTFLNSPEGHALLNSYKRANNILAGKKTNGLISENLFKIKAEHDLFASLELNTKKIEVAIKAKNFLESLKILASMQDVIANFFENVMVMDENPDIANNRLLLLTETKAMFDKIADFENL